MNSNHPGRPVLLIKTGGTIPETRDEFGDFEEWFARGLGMPGMEQVNVYSGEPLPKHKEYAAVIVTGSASMVSHREEWSELTAEWLAAAVHAGMPTLGVCFGHQLLAQALGGAVGPNPKGRQVGSRQIEFLPAAASDPLLCSMPASIQVQTTHVESVHELPPGAVRLATSPLDGNHAFRIGARAWGLQFHPEFGADIMRGYIRARAQIIEAEGFDVAQLTSSVVETPLAHGLLARFAALVNDSLPAPGSSEAFDLPSRRWRGQPVSAATDSIPETGA